jgi:hypothetical protein
MEFDPNKALAYARALSRPRLVGSGEDERVAQEIVARLESFGYEAEREPFQFTRAFDIALWFEIALALTLIGLTLILPTLRLYAGLILLGLLFLAQPLNRIIHENAVAPDPESGASVSPLTTFFLRWGKRYRTANIVARHKQFADSQAYAPTIYLVAHFDSKSQRLPIVLRMILIVVFILSTLIFALTAILTAFGSSLTLVVFSLVPLACGLPLLLLDVGNDSPGAIDNASGCGLVLHLAECLQARSDLANKIRPVILITGAEEMATMGAIFHVQNNQQKFRDWIAQAHFIYVLNFDGIGTDGKLYCAESEGYASPLWDGTLMAARDLEIPLAKFLMPGALFDHIPFSNYPDPINALSLLTVGKDSWVVHTTRDTANKLHPHGFELAGRVALKVIDWLADPDRGWG